jgi:hypothetical protein
MVYINFCLLELPPFLELDRLSRAEPINFTGAPGDIPLIWLEVLA